MSETRAKKIALRFFWFIFFTALIMASSVATYMFGPPSVKYTNESFNWEYIPPELNESKYNILLDTHSHTIYSDGVLTVEQNILWHIANGFNACVITDHDTWKHVPEVRKLQEKYADKILLFAGSEWTTNVIHMNLIFPLDAEGFEELIAPFDNNPSYEEIQETIRRTHELGGLVTINHFNWSIPRMPNHPTREQVYEWGADFIEVVNENTWDQASYDFVSSNEMGMVAGTDMHSPSPVHGWTVLWAENFTHEAVWKQLVAHNTSVIYNETGSPQLAEAKPNPAFIAVRPLYQLGDLLEDYLPDAMNPDWVGIVVLLAYLIGGFIIGEIIHETKPLEKLTAKIKKSKGSQEK